MDDPNLSLHGLDDAYLESLSVRELKDLDSRIEQAIRAAIRSRNAALANRSVTLVRAQEPVAPSVTGTLDLERERDAWLARRQGRQT